jgi:phage replication O-like protein O
VAKPQIEDGYTRIANETLEKIMKTNLNGSQLRIVLAVWRYTYGFQRKTTELSINFIAKAINSKRSHVGRELATLIDERKILTVTGTGKRNTREIGFNKNHNEWIDSPTSKVWQTLPPKPNKKKQPSNKKKVYDQDNTYFKMAQYFQRKVKEVAKAEPRLEHLTIKADLQKWADEFRKLVEIDKVEDKQLIKDVMDWVSTHDFWKTVVLSAKKFREKFTELAIKMGNPQKPKQQSHQPDPRDKDLAFERWVGEGKNPDEFDWS